MLSGMREIAEKLMAIDHLSLRSGSSAAISRACLERPRSLSRSWSPTFAGWRMR